LRFLLVPPHQDPSLGHSVISGSQGILGELLPGDWDINARLRFFLDIFNASLDSGAERGVSFGRLPTVC
jgi:hypothetical protein